MDQSSIRGSPTAVHRFFFAQPWSNIVDPEVPEVREAWEDFNAKLGVRVKRAGL